MNKSIEAEARTATREKKALERKLTGELKTWNNNVVRAFRANYPMKKLTKSLERQLIFILEKGHLRASKEFALVSLEKGKDEAEESVNATEEAVIAAILLFLNRQGEQNIESIIGTTNEILTETISRAQRLARDEEGDGNPLTPAAIALLAARLLEKRLNNRLPVISVTETNFPAEGTRSIQTIEVEIPLVSALEAEEKAISAGEDTEAATAAGVAVGVSAFSDSKAMREAGKAAAKALGLTAAAAIVLLRKSRKKIKEGRKTWVTMGDSRVRDIHQKASGQTVLRNKPFFVGGEYLMYPTDGSRGATGKNIIGCRCFAAYA